MKTPNEIKDNQVTLATTAGYLQTCLRFITREIDRYDEISHQIFLDRLEGADNTKFEQDSADLELGLAVEKHMKELKKAIASDPDVVDMLKRVMPAGIV